MTIPRVLELVSSAEEGHAHIFESKLCISINFRVVRHEVIRVLPIFL